MILKRPFRAFQCFNMFSFCVRLISPLISLNILLNHYEKHFTSELFKCYAILIDSSNLISLSRSQNWLLSQNTFWACDIKMAWSGMKISLNWLIKFNHRNETRYQQSLIKAHKLVDRNFYATFMTKRSKKSLCVLKCSQLIKCSAKSHKSEKKNMHFKWD